MHKPKEEIELSEEKRSALISDYMAEIGARGGKVQKGSKLRRELNIRAAHARWRKDHPKPIKISAAQIAQNNS